MKRFIISIILIALVSVGYVFYVEYTKQEEEIPIAIELEKTEISQYYIYGTHLNMKGSLTVDNLEFDSFDLVLYNKDIKNTKEDKEQGIDNRFTVIELNYNQEVDTVSFYLSDLINDGIYLDNIDNGEYNLFIRTASKVIDEKDNETIVYKYYCLDNTTDYKETIYYTMSKYDKKITINSDNEYSTMMFNVIDNNDSEIYDIVLDAGHGGIDPGAVANGTKETDFTLNMAKELKEKLENEGFTVKLTRDDDTLASDEWFDEYGKGGRSQISHEVYAKYLISIHLNSSISSSVNGIELYTAANINYDLATSIVDEIVNSTDIDYSNQKTYKMYNGVYTHNFTEYDISKSMIEYDKKGYIPYDVTTNSNYLYMIRETGGIMTGAYVDDRNQEKQEANEYYNSNVGTESYLLEVCYLSNVNDLETIREQQSDYLNAITRVLKEKLDT